jgi:alpha-mannosidase
MFRLKMSHGANISPYCPASRWATWVIGNLSLNNTRDAARRADFFHFAKHVYAYVMNNYWESNYRAGQEGEHRFRFSLSSRVKSDPVASSRFGHEAANLLVATYRAANPAATLPAAASLLSVAEPNVMIIGVKPSESGRALIVRLWEMEGKPTAVHLKLDRRLRAAKALACNLAEEPEGELPLGDGVVTAPIPARGLATVRVGE